MVTSSSFPDCLNPRPPTPPRDVSKVVDDAIDFLGDSLEIEHVLNPSRALSDKTAVTTTPEHPSFPQTQPDSLNASKKVGFSSTPTYHEPTRHMNPPVVHLQKHPRPVGAAKPLRSILKPGQAPLPPTPDDDDFKISYFSPEEPGSFPRMIRSVLQGLASQRLDQRLDAYLTLNGAFQQYDGIAEMHMMTSKMHVIADFLARDMIWKTENAMLDTNIVQQALKLTATVVSNRDLCASLSGEFRALIIDRSILVIETPDVPKAIVKLHLYLLSAQNFQAHVFTDSKASRLITALQTLEKRVSGNVAVATRLIIYHRLLDQARDAMLRRASDWFEHILHSLLSSQKELRTRALEVATAAGLKLGAEYVFSKAVRELFEIPMDEEEFQCYYEYFSVQLGQMISHKEDAPYVPQIWSSIILCFRSQKNLIYAWARFKSWLMLIQKCLNAGDPLVRYQANLAWNRLVFTVMPNSSTPRHIFSMLKVPCTTGLLRDGNDRFSKQSRQFALESFYNLLFYALRPGLTYEELDSAWDVYVVEIMSALLRPEASSKGRASACRALHGLFTPGSGLWNPNAAVENIQLKPADLHRVDPRWVRSRLAKVLRILEPIIKDNMWVEEEMATEALDATLHALFSTIAEAASQEVKTSNDLKEAMALLVNMFHRLWNGAEKQPSGVGINIFLNRYNDLLTNAVACITASPFAENILTRNSENGIEAALTPSSRPSKHYSAPHAPLVSLFGLLYQPPADISLEPAATSYAELASNTLDMLGSTSPTRIAKLGLVNHARQIWSSSYSVNAKPHVVRILYMCIAEYTTRILQEARDTTGGETSQTVGMELRHAQDILVAGLEHISAEPDCLAAVTQLMHTMMEVANATAGAGGVVLAVIEPCAREILRAGATIAAADQMRLAAELMLAKSWPASKQELEQSRKELWGMALTSHKGTPFDPLEQFYKLSCGVSINAYEVIDATQSDQRDAIVSFLDVKQSFIAACPLALRSAVLRHLQAGVVVWIRDERRTAFSEGLLSRKICEIWETILKVFESAPANGGELVRSLEPLLVSGLSSPFRDVVNRTIVFWNEFFGSGPSLDYPATLEAVLRARRNETELLLPGLSEDDGDRAFLELPPFYESQRDNDTTKSSAKPSTASTTHVPALAQSDAERNVPNMHKMPVTELSLAVESPVRLMSRSSARSTPKARLRHEDSQIRFAPINSSPLRFENTQNLTEHQKEVLEHQQENAQMLQGLSSSPAPEPPALPRSVQKKLVFTPAEAHEHSIEHSTPDGLAENEIGMNDDIPSSPTPSSGIGSDYNRILRTHDESEEPDDPPSSPPLAAESDQMDIASPEAATIENETTVFDAVDQARQAQQARPLEDQTIDSDYPDMSELPEDSRQLRLEEEAAELASEGLSCSISQASPIKNKSDSEMEKVLSVNDGSRVQDSFDESGHHNRSSSAGTEAGAKARREKRKRGSGRFTRSKKRKSQTSLESLRSPASGSKVHSQDEDDIGDEIMVAGTQHRPSPSPLPEGAMNDEGEKEEGPKSPPQRTPSGSRTLRSKTRQYPHKEKLHPALPAAEQDTTRAEETSSDAFRDGRKSRSRERECESMEHEQNALAGQGPTMTTVVTTVVPTPPEKGDAQKDQARATPPSHTDVAAVTPPTLLARMRSLLTDLSGVQLDADEDNEMEDMLHQMRQMLFGARRRSKGLP